MAENNTAEISDTEIRIRCAEAASRAFARGAAQNEPPEVFASFLMGMGNAFYGLASKSPNPEIALRAIDAAANGMMNAKTAGIPTAAFAGHVLAVAEEACAFALGQKDTMGHDHLGSVLKK